MRLTGNNRKNVCLVMSCLCSERWLAHQHIGKSGCDIESTIDKKRQDITRQGDLDYKIDSDKRYNITASMS